MNASVAAQSRAGRAGLDWLAWLRAAGPVALLIVVTIALGLAGQSVARIVFIGGCVVVAWDLLRFGPAAHLTGSLVLFCLAPFLRRVVDVHAGYEASGLMISGPLLAILTPTPLLFASLTQSRLDPALRPFLLAGACALYGALLTLVEGNLQQAASNGLKWIAPLIYGMWLYGGSRRDPRIVETAARAFMVLMPALGLYGFLQYVNPPIWDRYWMSYTTIASIGQPEPFAVRVFSTMNAPAGYATFTAAGLLLFGFRRVRLSLLLAAGPSVLGLMLSMYRTAWIALAVGIVVGLFHRRTWRRAAILLVTIPVLGAAVVAFTPAGAVLEARLETLGALASDGSGQERLAEYAQLLNSDGGTLIGHGFGDTDVMQAGALPLDGLFVVAWSAMGLVGAILCVTAFAWAALLAITRAWRNGTVSGLAVAAILAGGLAQVPLAVVSASEIGFLFWSLAGIGAGMRPAARGARGTL